MVAPTKAQKEMQQAITALGNNGFAGVYAANDDTGGGAIAAMKGAGINPTEKPTTGQDATVAGVQRIIVGTQYMTVYKAIEPEAHNRRRNRRRPRRRRRSPEGQNHRKHQQRQGRIPSILLEPMAVTKENVKSTVVKDGFIDSGSELCTGPYKARMPRSGDLRQLRCPMAVRSLSWRE